MWHVLASSAGHGQRLARVASGYAVTFHLSIFVLNAHWNEFCAVALCDGHICRKFGFKCRKKQVQSGGSQSSHTADLQRMVDKTEYCNGVDLIRDMGKQGFAAQEYKSAPADDDVDSIAQRPKFARYAIPCLSAHNYCVHLATCPDLRR